jgi:hypothetical protein
LPSRQINCISYGFTNHRIVQHKLPMMKNDTLTSSFRSFLILVITTLGLGQAQADIITVLAIGIENNNTSEFEQENGNRNDGNYYWENGDYTSLTMALDNEVTAINESMPLNWSSGMEPLSDGGADGATGFPRAMVNNTNGNSFSSINILFQMPDDLVSADLDFDLISPAGNSTHDVQALINGNLVWSNTGISTEDVVASIPVNVFNAGAENVLSFQRTGGTQPSQFAWIQFDDINLIATTIPEPSTVALLMLGLVGCRVMRRR